MGLDAGEFEQTVDPLAPAGDLTADIAAFTTVDSCVQTHAHLDPLVGDALEAIGYDTFLRDVCRVLDAAKARDSKRCAAIDTSTLRDRCEAVVAEIAGEPQNCPWEVSSKRSLGRRASCLAIAARDPRLCAGASEHLDRATCEAVARHDAAPCTRLPMRADQARCTRDEQRWHTATPAADASTATPFPPWKGQLRVENEDAGPPAESDLAVDLARGVVLVEDRNGTHVTLGTVTEGGAGFLATSPHRPTTLGVVLVKPALGAAGAGVHVEHAELILPGHLPLDSSAATSTLTAKLDKLEPTRGGRVEFSVDGTLGGAEGVWRVHAHGATFVRDIVGDAAADVPRAGAAVLRLGVDGGAR